MLLFLTFALRLFKGCYNEMFNRQQVLHQHELEFTGGIFISFDFILLSKRQLTTPPPPAPLYSLSKQKD